MQGTPGLWQQYRLRILSGLAGLALGASLARAAEPAPAAIAPAPAVSSAAAPLVLDLPGCRKLALEKQPALAAYRAGLTAAQAKAQALEELRLAALVRHDLPLRRQRAAQAVQAAQAQVCQAEWDTLYAVTRLYWTAVYAQT